MSRRRPYAARTAERQAEASAAVEFFNEGPGADLIANDPDARCSLCGKSCTAQDYCYGCSAWICSGCDHPDADKRPQGGKHVPQAHQWRPKALS